MVSRYVSKEELAQVLEVSITTVSKYLRSGCPYVEKGGSGKPYKFDLIDVIRWRYCKTGSTQHDGVLDPESLPPFDRLTFYKGSRERDRHMEERAQLVPAGDVALELAEIFKIITFTLESLPDVLERDAGLQPIAIQRAQATIDRIRDELYQRVVEFVAAPDEEDVADKSEGRESG